VHVFWQSKYSKLIRLCSLLLPVLLLALSACSKPPLTPLESDALILAFGDSLTAGKGVNSANAYPAVLEELTGLRVINAGVSGETTAEGLMRLPAVLQEHNPDLLILFEGGNDILRNQNLSQTRSNLDQMIRLAQLQQIEVALVGLPEKSLFSSVSEIYTQLANEHGLVLQEKIVASLLRKPSMKSDSVHFNVLGYRALAVAILEMLQDAGALSP